MRKAMDWTLAASVAGAIVFLAVLVWLMVRQARQPDWQKVSAQTRAARDCHEKKN